MGPISRTFALLALLMYATQSIVNGGTIVTADAQPSKCVVTIDGEQIIKAVGSSWYTNDSCVEHSCEVDDEGTAFEKLTEEVCRVTCKGEYEHRQQKGRCCGKCVKTKCLFNSKFYSIRDIWLNSDNCTVYECRLMNGEAEISAYEKVCPPVPSDCPQSDVYTEDCCTFCRNQPSMHSRYGNDLGVHMNEGEIGDKDFYRHHPCVRNCSAGAKPMTCNYSFLIEWYETLSKACYNCPNNLTDCYRPHCLHADGRRRSITVANRMMPGPSIEVCYNDTIVVDVKNHLLGETTTIHWHGMHQVETPYMDGVPLVSQCPIQPHSTFRYTFKAAIPGTHFWHSHTGIQRGDGLFGSLIIRKPKELDTHANLYDYDLPEHKIILQDWDHKPGVAMFTSHHHSLGDNKPPNILVNGHGRFYPEMMDTGPTLKEDMENDVEAISDFNTTDHNPSDPTITTLNTTNSTDAPEIILHHLHSEKGIKTKASQSRVTRSRFNFSNPFPLERFTVTYGQKYRFRVINAEYLNCPIAISVDNHTITVIASDGFDVEPIKVASIVTYAGERFDFVLNANKPIGNYWIRFKGLMDCDERFKSAFQVAILHYESAPDLEPEGTPRYDFTPGGIELNSLNTGPGYNKHVTINELKSAYTIDYDKDVLKAEPDHKFYVYYDFYPKNNPSFHLSELYGFNETLTTANKVLTPQLNHISLAMPSMPLLPRREEFTDSMFCDETSLKREGINCRKEFCQCHHILKASLDSVVEIILVDEGVAYDANHPFHLHGYAFHVIGLDRVGRNVTIEKIKDMDRLGQLQRNFDRPPIKDTVTVPDGGYTIIRFRADNPGYWLLHCHIEFHAEIGMALIIKVGENDQMMPTPRNFPQCSDYVPGLEEKEELNDARGGSVIFRLAPALWYLVISRLSHFYLF